MSLTGTEYGELRHNNRESGLDSHLDFREDRESSVNELLNFCFNFISIYTNIPQNKRKTKVIRDKKLTATSILSG